MASAADRLEHLIGARALLYRLNRWFINRLPSRRLAQTLTLVSPNGLHFRQGAAKRVIAWQAIGRVVATLTTQMMRETQILVLDVSMSNPVIVAETDPGWRELIENLNLHLPGAKRAATWQLELISSWSATQVFQRQDDQGAEGGAQNLRGARQNISRQLIRM